jgi:hypothetical protein
MRSLRSAVTLAALALLGGLTPASAQEKVLVAGNPPLTQEMVDQYQQRWQWYCDIKLTAEQRRQHRQHFVAFWKKAANPTRHELVTAYAAEQKQWREVLDMAVASRQRRRAEVRGRWMASLRQFPDATARLLVSTYDAAYKPGGAKNPILVAGDPPLTLAMIDLNTAAGEVVLDLRLSEKQRREYQRLLTEEWKGLGAAEKQKRARDFKLLEQLPTWSDYRRNEIRAFNQAQFRASWAKDPTAANRWWAALDREASRPGSARNPVLLNTNPPLTQLLVDRYIDYLEIMLDLSLGGGFTAPQRQVLQDHLVKDWKEMPAGDRGELLGDVKRWAAAAAGGADKANQCINALRPKVLTQLRTTSTGPRSAWLLEVFDQARALHRRTIAQLKRQHDKKASAIDAMPDGKDHGPGRWEYNPNTRKYDRWVPNR